MMDELYGNDTDAALELAADITKWVIGEYANGVETITYTTLAAEFLAEETVDEFTTLNRALEIIQLAAEITRSR